MAVHFYNKTFPHILKACTEYAKPCHGETAVANSLSNSVTTREIVLIYANNKGSGPPGVLGIWGEWLFIFRELGSTGNYFRGAGE